MPNVSQMSKLLPDTLHKVIDIHRYKIYGLLLFKMAYVDKVPFLLTKVQVEKLFLDLPA